MNQVWVPSISKLLFQLCLTQKVTTESLTGNGQVKKGSQLESMLPSMASLLQKKIWIKEPTSQWKYRKRVLCHVQSRARESQKRKTSHCTKSKCFTERGCLLFLGSLDQMVQKFLLALRIRGGLITSVIVISVAKALIARNSHLILDLIDLDSSSWAKSLFRRMGFKKRMKTTGKIVEQRKRPNFCIYMILCLWLMTIIFLIV